LYRFYNKIAELQYQYALLKRRYKDALPSFTELYGHPEEGVVLIRQVGQEAYGEDRRHGARYVEADGKSEWGACGSRLDVPVLFPRLKTDVFGH
jgi:hypothetical protein